MTRPLRNPIFAAVMGGLILVPQAATGAPIDDAVNTGATHAAERGVTSYISVIDRQTGNLVSETGNAHVQVASESIMKLFIAGWYAVQAGGHDRLLASRRGQLEYMVIYSDDGTASSLFNASLIPDQAARYGLGETGNASPPGHWGAARITAHDMAVFLHRMSNDALVGPWLISVMAQVAPWGSDGFNQRFGFNALTGEHGSKQGWGNDNWTSQRNAIHSVGYTDQWFAAILQTGGVGTYLPMRDTSTYTAQLLQAARRPSVSNPVGQFDHGALNPLYYQLSGWALDPDNPNAVIAVDIYDNGPRGLIGLRLNADGARPDVNSVLGLPGNHGFTATIQLAGGGDHRVCAYAVNIGPGDGNPLLGCRDVFVSDSPVGSLDSASISGFDLTVSGWAVDPEALQQPLPVHIYDYRSDGSPVGYATATAPVNRPDVSGAFPGVGGNQGFGGTIRLTGGGSHRICAYGVGVGSGGNALLGCRTVVTPVPLGSVDAVSRPAPGLLTVEGWSFDPDVPEAVLDNHIYVSDANGAAVGYPGFFGSRSRPDVAAVFPGAGDRHGFTATMAVPAGVSTVCVYAISARNPATNPGIGCRSVPG